mgnify:CR=1 FL=1
MTYGSPRHYKTDSNCKEIVSILRKLGFRVHVTNAEWDLTVQFHGLTMLCEVRPEDKPKVARKGRQELFHGVFSVYWLSSHEDCLNLRKTLLNQSEVIRENLCLHLSKQERGTTNETTANHPVPVVDP